jgi:hypothetical protein
VASGGEAVTVDALDSVYVTGSYGGSLGTLKYDAAGNELWLQVYSSAPIGSPKPGVGIAVDASGSVFVTGSSGRAGGWTDYVTLKYDSVGNQLWAQLYDAAGFFNDPTALALDSDGNVYVTGGSWLSGSSSSSDYATVKYSTDGTQLWVSRFNGPDNLRDEPKGIAVDSINGNVYVTGFSNTSAFTSLTNTVQLDAAAGTQLCVMTETGSQPGFNQGAAVAVDSAGNAHITGTNQNAVTDILTVKYATGPGNHLANEARPDAAHARVRQHQPGCT